MSVHLGFFVRIGSRIPDKKTLRSRQAGYRIRVLFRSSYVLLAYKEMLLHFTFRVPCLFQILLCYTHLDTVLAIHSKEQIVGHSVSEYSDAEALKNGGLPTAGIAPLISDCVPNMKTPMELNFPTHLCEISAYFPKYSVKGFTHQPQHNPIDFDYRIHNRPRSA